MRFCVDRENITLGYKLGVCWAMTTTSFALAKTPNDNNYNHSTLSYFSTPKPTSAPLKLFSSKQTCAHTRRTLFASTAATAPSCILGVVPPSEVVSKRSSRLYAVRQRSWWPRDCTGDIGVVVFVRDHGVIIGSRSCPIWVREYNKHVLSQRLIRPLQCIYDFTS